MSSNATDRNGKAYHGPMDGAADMRRHRRKPVILAAQLEASTGIFECIIFNLSSGGAKLKLEKSVPVDEPAVLVVGKVGAFACTIVRSVPGEAAIQFAASPDEVSRRLDQLLPLKTVRFDE